MPCALCEAFRRKYPLVPEADPYPSGPTHVHRVDDDYSVGPIQCAFETSDVFSPDNWSCQTLGRIRPDVGDDGAYVYHNDSRVAVIPIPQEFGEDQREGVQSGFLILGWYKWHGQIEQAVVIHGEDPPQPLTLKTALHILLGKLAKPAADEADRLDALAELTRQAQELNMGY